MITPASSTGANAPLPPPLRPRPAAATLDAFSADQTAHLQAALARTPAIRPEVVARAAELAADPGYPSPEIIGQVAALIAGSPDLSEIPE